MKTGGKNVLRCAAAAMMIASAALAGESDAEACTRIVYRGDSSLYVVGRSLDWKTPIRTNIYVYPRGMQKRSDDAANCLTWTSKYGAVYAVGYDGGVTEGMNEEGLSINGLFCKGTVYNSSEQETSDPTVSLSVFVAWLLDLNSTTAEVVNTLRNTKFVIRGSTFDGGTVSALHWGVTDRFGHSAIFEFDHGKINIYEGDDLVAMTNDPVWPQMSAILAYWEKIGGKNFLPGSVSSPDRCVRAHYFVTHVEKTADDDLGVSIARSVLLNCSVPYTYMIEGEPNLSSTQWRSFSNLRERRYYFDIVTNPGYYYVDLKKLNLRPGAPVLKLDTAHTADLVGDADKRLKKSEPFKPMW